MQKVCLIMKSKSCNENKSFYTKIILLLVDCLKQSQNELEALSVLARMWTERIFCDLIIVANGREHLGHRVALAFYSEKYK